MTSEGARTGTSHFFLNLARVMFGLMFVQHGAQKLFGILGREEVVGFLSQLWFAGMIELWGGFLVVVGLFTRPVAFLAAGLMAWAYAQSHVPRGFFPIENGGERAVLFCFFFLFLAANGGGAFSLDGLFRGRRRNRTV